MLPLAEKFDYVAFEWGGRRLLAAGPGANRLASFGRHAFTPVCLRYAFLLYTSRQPFFPTLAADDLGVRYKDLQAFDWLSESGLLYPRADAVGVHADGTQDQLFLKELDLAVPAVPYVSAGEGEFPGWPVSAALQVVAEGDFAICPGGNFPPRLLAILPAVQLHVRIIGARLESILPRLLAVNAPIGLDEFDGFAALP